MNVLSDLITKNQEKNQLLLYPSISNSLFRRQQHEWLGVKCLKTVYVIALPDLQIWALKREEYLLMGSILRAMFHLLLVSLPFIGYLVKRRVCRFEEMVLKHAGFSLVAHALEVI